MARLSSVFILVLLTQCGVAPNRASDDSRFQGGYFTQGAPPFYFSLELDPEGTYEATHVACASISVDSGSWSMSGQWIELKSAQRIGYEGYIQDRFQLVQFNDVSFLVPSAHNPEGWGLSELANLAFAEGDLNSLVELQREAWPELLVKMRNARNGERSNQPLQRTSR